MCEMWRRFPHRHVSRLERQLACGATTKQSAQHWNASAVATVPHRTTRQRCGLISTVRLQPTQQSPVAPWWHQGSAARVAPTRWQANFSKKHNWVVHGDDQNLWLTSFPQQFDSVVASLVFLFGVRNVVGGVRGTLGTLPTHASTPPVIQRNLSVSGTMITFMLMDDEIERFGVQGWSV